MAAQPAPVPGGTLPPVRLTAHDGSAFDVSDLREQSHVVLYAMRAFT